MAAAAQIGTTIFHPVGTVRMKRDERAVFDTGLRVRGIEGMCIVAASVMLTIASGNTALTVIVIAAKAAWMIAARDP